MVLAGDGGGFRSKVMKKLDLFTFLDHLDDFAERNVNVEKPQAADRRPEVWLVPKILQVDLVVREKPGQVV